MLGAAYLRRDNIYISHNNQFITENDESIKQIAWFFLFSEIPMNEKTIFVQFKNRNPFIVLDEIKIK